MAQGQQTGLDDARRFARVAYEGQMVYRYASDDEGTAQVCDVSRGGLRMRMGRYLRPGTRIMLEAAGVKVNGQPIELKGQIVWCTPERRVHRFTAGIRVIYDEPDAITAASALVNHALVASGVFGELSNRAVPAVAHGAVWPVRGTVHGTRGAGARFVAGNA